MVLLAALSLADVQNDGASLCLGDLLVNTWLMNSYLFASKSADFLIFCVYPSEKDGSSSGRAPFCIKGAGSKGVFIK